MKRQSELEVYSDLRKMNYDLERLQFVKEEAQKEVKKLNELGIMTADDLEDIIYLEKVIKVIDTLIKETEATK